MPEIYLAWRYTPTSRIQLYRASRRWWETRRFLEHGLGGKVLYLIRVTPKQRIAA